MSHYFANGAGLVRVWGQPDPCEEQRKRDAAKAASDARVKREQRAARRAARKPTDAAAE